VAVLEISHKETYERFWEGAEGRTEGVKNPFKEPVRFVGLRKLGVGDEWD
jgi:hypothetical protein